MVKSKDEIKAEKEAAREAEKAAREAEVRKKTVAYIRTACEAVGISRLVHVDDAYAAKPGQIEERLQELEPEQADTLIEKHPLLRELRNPLSEPGDPPFDAAGLEGYLASLNQEQSIVLFDAAGEAAGRGPDQGIGSKDNLRVPEFTNLFEGAELKVECRTGREFRDLLSNAGGDTLGDVEHTFFALDIDFQQEGLGADDGYGFAAALLRLATLPAAVALVARTDAPGSAADEEQKRRELARRLGDDANIERAAVIGKFRIKNGGQRLPHGLRRGLLGRAFSEIRPHVEAAVKNAQEVGLTQLQALDLPTFADVIVGNSVREGAWPPDDMAALAHLYEMDETYRTLRSNGEVRQLSARYEPVATLPSEKPQNDEVLTGSLAGITRKHFFQDAAHLQAGPLPPALGDVFKLGGGYFILVAQPCDLAIRAGGWRGKVPESEADVRVAWAACTTLLPLKETDPTNKKDKPDEGETDLRVGPPGADPAVRRVSLKSAVPVPLWLIDHACGCGSEAALRVVPAPAVSPVPGGWAQRLMLVRDWIAEIADDCRIVAAGWELTDDRIRQAVHGLYGLGPLPGTGPNRLGTGYRRPPYVRGVSRRPAAGTVRGAAVNHARRTCRSACPATQPRLSRHVSVSCPSIRRVFARAGTELSEGDVHL